MGEENENVNFDLLLNSEDYSEKYPITDIDMFYTGLYNYYIERGYYSIVIKSIGKLLFNIVNMASFFVITLCINWYNVIKSTRLQLFEFDIDKTNKFWLYFVLGTIIMLSIQLILNTIYTIKHIYYMKKIRYFYNKIFCISDDSLTFLKWNQIESLLLNMKNEGKFEYIRKEISNLSITKRIMRKQNYIILLLESKYLNKYYISEELINQLNFLLLIFNDKYLLNKEYLQSKSCYYWLKIFSVINLILIPFKLLYIIMIFFLTNMEALYTNKDVVGNRHWIEKHFYLYNEYTHLLKNRLARASYYMDLWVLKNPNTILDSILIFIISLSGSIISLFTPIIIINGQFGEYLIWGNPILWYVACFTTIIIISRKYLSKVQQNYDNTKYTHNKLKEKILFYTCKDEPKIPDKFYNQINNNIRFIKDEVLNKDMMLTQLVYKNFSQLYTYTIINFIKNIYSIFTLPYILNILSNSHLSVGDYIIKHTITDIDGDMCIFSDFENIKSDDVTFKKSLVIFTNRNKEFKNEINDILLDLNDKKENSIIYNPDEDEALLNSNMFIQKDTSTIINEDINNIV